MSLRTALQRFLDGSSLSAVAAVGLLGGCACPPVENEPYTSSTPSEVAVDVSEAEYEEAIDEAIALYRANHPSGRDVDFLISLEIRRGSRLGDALLDEASPPPPYTVYTDQEPVDLVASVPESYLSPRVTAALVDLGDGDEVVTYVCDAMCQAAGEPYSDGPPVASGEDDFSESGPPQTSCDGVTSTAFNCVTVTSGTIQRYGNCAAGRRPAGYAQEPLPATGDATAQWWAEICRLEQAAVVAFVNLARELRSLDAPDELVAGALDAARDEVRHTRQTAAMVRRHGGEVPTAHCPTTERRSLRALAEDNAIEGCIRESFAAWQMRWQARRTDDPLTAHLLDRIGEDETRHGDLSWRIHRWCLSQLPPADRKRLHAAQTAALDEMAAQAHTQALDTVGLPTATEQVALLDAFRSACLAA